jgi:hypothetical protein
LTERGSADGLESPEGIAARDWPVDIRKNLLDILRDDHASATDLLPAAELAGDSSIMNDALKDALRSILQN